MSNPATLREGQLIAEISALNRRVADGEDTESSRNRPAQAYLRELLRYQRAGEGARWQRRPELH